MYLAEYDLAEHFGRLEHRKAILYQRRLQRLPPARPGADKLCDIGCGDGQFLAVARAHGWSGTGVDLNPPAAARARERGFTVIEGEFEELDGLSWDGYDLVTSWDALEHTPKPAEFVARLVRLARPGGLIALTTLNVASIVSKTFGMRWSMIAPDHFTYWSRGSLTRLLTEHGLEIVDAYSFGIGRDFAAPLDRLVSAFRRSRADRSPGISQPNLSWDSSGAVVRIEERLNDWLDRSGAGVGIGVTARKLTAA